MGLPVLAGINVLIMAIPRRSIAASADSANNGQADSYMAIAVLTGVALQHHPTHLLIPDEVTLTPRMQTTNSPKLPTPPDQLLRWQIHGRLI